MAFGHKQHHHRHPRAEHAKGGKVEPRSGGVEDEKIGKETVYAGGGSKVEREAEEKKRGGRTKGKHVGAEGKKARMRLDRPGRKRGGGVGADSSPLTTAARVTPASAHKGTMDGNAEDGP